MPPGRICISHEQQMIVTTALLIVDHVFESHLYDRFLGPSLQSVLMVLLERQCNIFMYFIRANGHRSIGCVGTGATLHCFGYL